MRGRWEAGNKNMNYVFFGKYLFNTLQSNISFVLLRTFQLN